MVIFIFQIQKANAKLACLIRMNSATQRRGQELENKQSYMTLVIVVVFGICNFFTGIYSPELSILSTYSLNVVPLNKS